MSAECAPAVPSPPFTVYYWRRGFLLLAPSFVLDRSRNPYRRLAATLMFALKEPFTLETGESDRVVVHAALIAPKVARRRIVAIGSDIVICDLAVATPEFNALSPLLGVEPVRVLDAAHIEPLRQRIERAQTGELPDEDVRGLLHEAIFQFSGQRPTAPALHPRIMQVLRLIEERPLRSVSLAWLAEQVHLSPSRLRHLFSEQIGCSLTHYLRWTAVWKGVWLWSRGQPLIEVVEAVGFHDLAHLNRAANEVFGLNPSAMLNPSQVRLRRCAWD